jgi:hypothetical protein
MLRLCAMSARDVKRLAGTGPRCPRMGQNRKSSPLFPMSALPWKRTFIRATVTSALCQNRKWRLLFNHLVGAADQRERHGNTERLCGLEVNNQFYFADLLDRQVGGLLALENAAGIVTSQVI